MAISPDGRRVYVANYGEKSGSSLSVIDTATNTTGAPIPLSGNPAMVKVAGDGKVYLTTLGGGIFVYDPTAGSGVREYGIGTGTGPGLGISANSSLLYAAHFSSGVVSVIDTSRMTVLKTFNPTRNPYADNRPRAFAVDVNPRGRYVYVCSPSDKMLHVVDTNGGPSRDVALEGEPWGIAVAADGGKVYLAANKGNALYVVDTTANYAVQPVPLPGNASVVTLSPDGHLAYVASGDGTDLFVIDTASTTLVQEKPSTWADRRTGSRSAPTAATPMCPTARRTP